MFKVIITCIASLYAIILCAHHLYQGIKTGNKFDLIFGAGGLGAETMGILWAICAIVGGINAA